MRSLFCALCVAISAVLPNDFLGDWTFFAETPQGKVGFSVHISEEGSKINCPSAGLVDFPLENVQITDENVTASIPSFGVQYTVSHVDGGVQLKVEASGEVEEYSLARGIDPKIYPKRTQEPKPPYPYIVEEVTIPHQKEELSLAGTLTMPKKNGPFRTLIMITGSGDHDRDETIVGHKPFKVLADHLTRKGYAVLRFDDRGVGGSGGSIDGKTFARIASDVNSVIAYAKKRPEVASIGLLGHSEGGMIAPMVTSKNDSIDFLVLIAGPGVLGKEVLAKQQLLIKKSMGMDEKAIEQHAREYAQFEKIVFSDMPMSQKIEEAKEIYKEQQGAFEHIKHYLNPWFKDFLLYKPSEYSKGFSVPTLAIFGGKDLQVAAEQNAEPMEKLLTHKRSNVRVYPNLNHLMQTANTGAMGEYGLIEETISPSVLDEIVTWLGSLSDNKST